MHHYGPYSLIGVLIDITTMHRDLDINFDDQLKVHDYTTQVTNKVNRVLGLTKRSLTHLFSTLWSGSHGNVLKWLLCNRKQRIVLYTNHKNHFKKS